MHSPGCGSASACSTEEGRLPRFRRGVRSWASEAVNRVRIDHVAAQDTMEVSLKVAERVIPAECDWNTTGRKWWRAPAGSAHDCENAQ
jgi:hypothetical protein